MKAGRSTVQVWIAAAIAGATVVGAIGLDAGPRSAVASQEPPTRQQSELSLRTQGKPGLEAVRVAAEQEARADIAAGKYRVLTYGLPSLESFRAHDLLEERHGIVVEPIAGCIIDEEIAVRAKAYNAVSRPAIERKFGKDVFERARREAQEASVLRVGNLTKRVDEISAAREGRDAREQSAPAGSP